MYGGPIQGAKDAAKKIVEPNEGATKRTRGFLEITYNGDACCDWAALEGAEACGQASYERERYRERERERVF